MNEKEISIKDLKVYDKLWVWHEDRPKEIEVTAITVRFKKQIEFEVTVGIGRESTWRIQNRDCYGTTNYFRQYDLARTKEDLVAAKIQLLKSF